MKNVLILGGSGLVGSAIIRELSTDKRLCLFSTVYQRKAPLTADRTFSLDVGQPDQIHSILRQTQPQVIISCLRGDLSSQLAAHTIAAEYLNENGGVLYFFSTANVFDRDMIRAHRESDQPDSCTDYGRYKIACEQKLTALLRERTCIIRIPQVWGKNSPRLNQLKNATAPEHRVVVYPRLSISTITDTMIAKKLAYVMEHNLCGIFHFSAVDSIRYDTFYRELAAKLAVDEAVLEENTEEAGDFVLLSEREAEFPKPLSFSNRDVIRELTDGI
ncbi:MAG TPA: sugar nucleotide-binding protein [Clostridiales bacterium]|nr:sugar nucleotide-binding protein [Clostridiales bacterium]